MTASVLVGLMSGTSLDGITAAVARFRPGIDRLSVELLAHLTHPYTAEQRERLGRALEGAPPSEYCRLGFELGGWLADAAVAALAEAGVARENVRAIASHGQTVWHEPGHSTWQFGEAAVIAERTGIGVVSDFRVRDMAAGGQGAPLVPIADALLFSDDHGWRALQNIGGIGNVTVVPPAASSRGGGLESVRAFDTGPGVAIIDGVTRLLDPARRFDVDGAMAAAGKVIEPAVRELLADRYFAEPPPKSTGREKFSAAYARALIARCRELDAGARPQDIVATATALTARSIADAYDRFLPEPIEDVLVSGGGARNPTLMAMIEEALRKSDRQTSIRQFDDVFFDGEAKEAVAFALLGFLHLENRTGNVPGATGARGRRVLGKWSPP